MNHSHHTGFSPLLLQSSQPAPRSRWRSAIAGISVLVFVLALTAVGLLKEGDPVIEARPVSAPDLQTVWSADGAGYQDTPWENIPLSPRVTPGSEPTGSVSAYSIPAFGSRCENVADFPKFREGQEYYFTFSTYLTPEVPLETAEWQVIAQWKNDGLGSPPLSLAVSSGRFELTGGYGWPGVDAPTQSRLSSRDVGAASHSTWDRWIVRIIFSSDPSVGTVDAWRNGRTVVAGWHPDGGTLYPGRESYLKVGYYRSQAIDRYAEVLHRDWRIAVPATARGGGQAS